MRTGHAAALVVIPLLFLGLLLPVASPAQQEILPFEPDDTLEEIRYKIEHNGYDFTVDHNWVFDLTPGEKAGFFSRRLPISPRYDRAAEDMG